MPIEEEIIADACDYKNSGQKAREALRFIVDHRHQSTNFFEEASKEGLIYSQGLRRAVNGLARTVDYQLYTSMSERDYEKATHVLYEQFKQWGIAKEVCPYSGFPQERGHDCLFKTSIQPLAVIYFESPGSIGLSDNKALYNLYCLKALNCLTDLYYGERLLPNIQPAYEHLPQSFKDLVEKADVDSNTDEIQAYLWEQGFLQCDLRQ